MEELAKLKAGLAEAGPDPDLHLALSPIEQAWMDFYAGDGGAFRAFLRKQFTNTDPLEARFVFVWLGVKSHGMADIIAWARDAKVSDAKRASRKAMLQAVVNMLADDATFEFAMSDIETLGAAMLYSNTEAIDIARKLSNRQRHSLALALMARA